jgi:peptidoglycan biosynthesis protein MviN/MurJ (putative lipid II flippase)
VKELVHLALPRTGTNVITQLRTIFFTGLATTFGSGGLSSYLFAQRVTDSVTQLIQQSVTTASLPVLSKDFLEGKNKEYRTIVQRYVLILGGIGLFAALTIFSLENIIVSLLYGDTGANSVIIFFLNGFLIALPFTMMSGYFSISLYAMKDTKSVFVSFLVGTIFSVCVGLWFQNKGEISLVLAYISWSIAQFLLLLSFYSRKKHTT